jgi:hypothetical protein
MSLDRAFQATRKMRAGSLGGQSRVAAPVNPYTMANPIGVAPAATNEPLPEPCVEYLGTLSGTHSGSAVFPYLTPDLSTLVVRSSGSVSRYSWPSLTLIDQLTVTGGQTIAVTNTHYYVHVGFNLRSYPLGSTASTNIGTTITSGGGTGGSIILASDGSIYLLDTQVAGPNIRQWASTAGPSSQPANIVETFANYDLANQFFFGDGTSIWASMRHDTSGDWKLIHYDVVTDVATDLGAFPAVSGNRLMGVLEDGTLAGPDASSGLLRITPDVSGASFTTETLCSDMVQGQPMFTSRQGSTAVGIVAELGVPTIFHVYRWTA